MGQYRDDDPRKYAPNCMVGSDQLIYKVQAISKRYKITDSTKLVFPQGETCWQEGPDSKQAILNLFETR